MHEVIKDSRGSAKTWLIVILAFLVTGGAGVGGYAISQKKSNEELSSQEEIIKDLRDQIRNQVQATPSPALVSDTVGGSSKANTSVTYKSANTGFTVKVPKSWSGQWRYSEQANDGIASNSVTFYLINKEVKYAPVVTIGKIPQTKYDDARASGSTIGNPENLLKQAGGFAYVMIFADGSVGDYKNFTYDEATKAAKASFQATFKTL